MMQSKFISEEGETTQYMKESDKQLSTQKTKDRLSNANSTKHWMNSGASEGLAVPAQLVTPVMLVLSDTNSI
jgi:hypothetical protein